MKILYVEDEFAHVALTRRALEDNFQQEFELLHAETIAAAISMVEANPDIDLILTDLRLPDGTGHDLLKKVNEGKTPPAVILVTGQGDQENAVAALKAGAADYLVKQSDYLHRLPVAITNAMARNRLIREQAALREAEIKYQSLVEQTPAVVFLDAVDENETGIYISPSVESLTGYLPEEWLSDSNLWDHLVYSEDQSRIDAAYQESHRNNTPFVEEYRIVRRDGDIVWVKENTNLVRGENGKALYWQGILLDITQDKENEAALQRQLGQLTVLHSIALAGTESNSEDEIIERIVGIASQIYDEVCGVLLLNEKGDLLTPHPSYFGADVSNWRDGSPISDGVTGKSVSLGKTLRLGDITQEPAFIEIASGTRSELCVPIRVNTRIIGIFNVESKAFDAFDDEDEQFLNTVAGSLGTALERLRLVKEEQRRAKESYESELARREYAETLQEVIASLSTTLDIQALYQTILDSLPKLVNHDSTSIFLEYENGDMEIVAARGFATNTENVVGRKIQKSAKWHELALARKPLIMADAQTDPRFEKWEGSEAIRGWLGVPMIAQDKVIGFINLDSHQVNAFTAQEATIIQTFANSAAIAIGNALLYRDALRAAERRAVLHQISQDVVRFSQDSEQIYTSIHGAASKLMPCDVFTISMRNATKDVNDFVYRVEGDHRYPFESFDSNAGLTSKIIGTGKSIILRNDTEIEDSGALRFGPPKHVRSAVLVPMRIGERIIGTISAQSYQPNAYGDEEQALLEMLATHAATAIENARLYDEAQNRIKEMETINRLSSSLRTTHSQSEMLDIFLDETLDLLGEENGSVWLYDHSMNVIVQRAARGVSRNIKHNKVTSNEGIVAHVFQSGEVYTSSDLRNDPLIFKPNLDVILPGYGGVCIPIKSTAGTLGATIIQMAPNRQVTEHTNLLITLAEIIGNSIHRAELFEHSQEQIHRLTTLRDIDTAIASSTDLRVTLNILTEHTRKHLKVDAVNIMAYYPELQSLTHLCSAGFSTPSPSRPLMRIGEGLAGQVVIKGRTDHVVDLKNSSEAKRNPMLAREGFVTYIGVPLLVKGQIKGVFEVFQRSILNPTSEWMQFLQTLAGQAAIAIDNSQLFDNLQRSNQELTQAYDTTLEGWARALELRDRETEGHTRRVTDLTLRLAHSMGIGEDELVTIYRGVLLHDIGKMGVPDQILKKTGPLNETEWLEMRLHPQYAFDLLSPITYLKPALDIPYCHHEHWDGSGYPRGLKGEQIPLAARIFSVVDIWDALLSDRPYRNAWPKENVIDYIKDISGTILDPVVVTAFLALIHEQA
jgi:PAS domain S-box-containing protein